MRVQLFTTALIATVQAIYEDLPTVQASDFTQEWFDAKVDHFNYQSTKTYPQRYWRNDVYCEDKETCPIFVYICGEYTCSVPAFRFFPFMIGAAHGASLLVVEHRYYGESQPYEDWSSENLVHLSSEQALADLAELLTAQGAGANKKTLVIGGSYPGALSAWFRVHYPHIALASWASSGVVQPIVDFWEFDNQVYTSAMRSGQACVDSVQRASFYVEGQGLNRDDGDSNNAIDNFLNGTSSAGMRTDDFMFYYADIFVESVQYGNRTDLCDMLAANVDKSDQQIFELVTQFGAEVAGVNPPDYDTRELQKTEINFGTSGRQWTYQYCTEYGWFQTPAQDQAQRMRTPYLDMDFWPAMCERVFGFSMVGLPQWEQTTISESGFNGMGTNTFFTNGVEDPWQWATIRETNEPSQHARTSDCPDCGHCVEMYTPTDSDPAEVNATRDDIRAWIQTLFGAEKVQQFLQ